MVCRLEFAELYYCQLMKNSDYKVEHFDKTKVALGWTDKREFPTRRSRDGGNRRSSSPSRFPQ